MFSVLPRPGAGEAKKLTEAASLWASGSFTHHDAPAQTATVEDSLAAWGLQIDSAAPLKPTPPPEFYLWPCNVPAWQAFLGCSTQWHIKDGVRTGLDYSAVQIVIGQHRIRHNRAREVFGLVQAMEQAALNQWAEQNQR